VTDQDVQLLLADLALIIVLARLLGAAARKIGQPPVLGEIVAGILLGPTIWGGRITAALFPHPLLPPLTALADLGLVLFMFVVGYEVDLGLIKGRERVAASVAVGSMLAPLVLGAGLGAWLVHRHHPHNPVTFVLFFGTAMSITAFPVLARILTDRSLHRTRIGGLALASASADDVLAWTLLAAVVAIAGSGSNQLRLLLAPVYAAAIIWLVRPLVRRLADSYQRQGRLTPNVLAAILTLLLLSSWATDWMGVKFIFGAFIFGVVMPRDVLALREETLERLEQVSVLVLLPVFFVVAGLSVNLSGLGLAGLAELGTIMLVAVAGKFGGAYYGARLTGVRPRQAGALAALMNTRGLTELVILTVGLQLHILDKALYSLMVVMAVVTTAMAGPLLRVIYPEQIMQRDIAEADRAMLTDGAAHRVVVVIDDPETAGPLVDVAVRVAASRPRSEVVLSHLVPHRQAGRLEVGAGVGGELLVMTQTMRKLHDLSVRAAERAVICVVQARFSDDVTEELPGFVAAAQPQTIVLGVASGQAAAGRKTLIDRLGSGGTVQIVLVVRPLPPSPSAIVAHWVRGRDADAAVQVGAQLAVPDGLDLVLTPADRSTNSRAADLTRRGLAATAGTAPRGAIVVAPASAVALPQADAITWLDAALDWPGHDGGAARDDSQVHLLVVAGTHEASDDIDQWVAALDRRIDRESSPQESRSP